MVERLASLTKSEKVWGGQAGTMGAMEQVSADGDEANFNDKKGESLVSKSMQRVASVDDLFAPMWQLNVQSSGSTPSASHQNVSVVDAASFKVPPTSHATRIAESGAAPAVASGDRKEGATDGRVRPSYNAPAFANFAIARDEQSTGTCLKSQKPASKQDGFERKTIDMPQEGNLSRVSDPEAVDVKPPVNVTGYNHDAPTAKAAKKSGSGRSGSGDAADPLPPSNSASDEDQHAGAIDERKQKRMLSNRESARRSRLRKQQHLDELRAQVAHLRAENNHMMTKFTIASQRYDFLTKENRELRSHAMALTSQLQRLHQTASQHPGGLRALGLQPGHLDPAPFGTAVSGHHSPYMVPDMLH